MTTYQRQLLLEYLGFSPGPLDGLDGPKTREACRRFQSAFGLPATGAFDDATDQGLIDEVSGAMTPVDKSQSGGDSDWWEDIRYFKKSEFACKCGGRYCNGYPVEIDMNMVKIADQIRSRIGKPITVNSGLRCKTHNANVGGVSNSQHLLGNAADLGCPSGCTPAQMASIAESIMGDTGGIGIYSWGIHIDTRSAKSRWNG